MPSRYFPPSSSWDDSGLVAVGGRLSVERLLDAYRNGIFPWPSSAYEPMLWHSPQPRAVLPLDRLHVPRRLQRRLRGGEFQFSADRAFAEVIAACASGQGREGGTWLTPAMQAAYTGLHELGHAHSVEAWQGERLVGGTYGVAIGGAFAAESMFHRERDASKAALVRLVRHLVARGYQLLDVQQWTPHVGAMGAIEVPRRAYLRRLSEVVDLDVTFND